MRYVKLTKLIARESKHLSYFLHSRLDLQESSKAKFNTNRLLKGIVSRVLWLIHEDTYLRNHNEGIPADQEMITYLKEIESSFKVGQEKSGKVRFFF